MCKVQLMRQFICGFLNVSQIRDKEKSNGQLREELGGVLEKNKNIMLEVGGLPSCPLVVVFYYYIDIIIWKGGLS